MNRNRKIGILLILIGIGLPLVVLMLTTGGSSHGVIDDIQDREIVLWKSTPKPPTIGLWDIASKISNMADRKAFVTDVLKEAKETGKPFDEVAQSKIEVPTTNKIIPYKYIFAFGVISLFVGIGLTILSNKKGEQ